MKCAYVVDVVGGRAEKDGGTLQRNCYCYLATLSLNRFTIEVLRFMSPPAGGCS